MLTIGLMITHSPNFNALEYNIPSQYTDQLQEYLCEKECRLLVRDIVMDAEQAKAERAYFEEQDVDYVLMLISDFSGGDAFLVFDGYSKPMGVWAPTEPTTSGDIQLNSTVSLNLFLSMAQRTYKNTTEVKWFYGSVANPLFKNRMDVTIGALKALKSLQTMKVGFLGQVAPSFYNLETELLLECKYGLETVDLSFEEFVREVEKVTVDEAELAKKEIVATAKDVSSLPEKSLLTGAKCYVALSKMMERYEIDTLSAVCWPEMQDQYQIVPCVLFSMLGDKLGIPAACEGDRGAALTMKLIQAASGEVPTFMDLAGVSLEDNNLLLWHCGIGTQSLCDEDTSIIPHPMLDRKNPERELMGLTYDYKFKEQEVTVLRYSNNQELICFSAQVKNEHEGYSGTRGYITDFKQGRKEFDAIDVMDTLMKNGIEHHLIVCRGNHVAAMQEFCKLAKIPFINMETYSDVL